MGRPYTPEENAACKRDTANYEWNEQTGEYEIVGGHTEYLSAGDNIATLYDPDSLRKLTGELEEYSGFIHVPCSIECCHGNYRVNKPVAVGDITVDEWKESETSNKGVEGGGFSFAVSKVIHISKTTTINLSVMGDVGTNWDHSVVQTAYVRKFVQPYKEGADPSNLQGDDYLGQYANPFDEEPAADHNVYSFQTGSNFMHDSDQAASSNCMQARCKSVTAPTYQFPIIPAISKVDLGNSDNQVAPNAESSIYHILDNRYEQIPGGFDFRKLEFSDEWKESIPYGAITGATPFQLSNRLETFSAVASISSTKETDQTSIEGSVREDVTSYGVESLGGMDPQSISYFSTGSQPGHMAQCGMKEKQDMTTYEAEPGWYEIGYTYVENTEDWEKVWPRPNEKKRDVGPEYWPGNPPDDAQFFNGSYLGEPEDIEAPLFRSVGAFEFTFSGGGSDETWKRDSDEHKLALDLMKDDNLPEAFHDVLSEKDILTLWKYNSKEASKYLGSGHRGDRGKVYTGVGRPTSGVDCGEGVYKNEAIKSDNFGNEWIYAPVAAFGYGQTMAGTPLTIYPLNTCGKGAFDGCKLGWENDRKMGTALKVKDLDATGFPKEDPYLYGEEEKPTQEDQFRAEGF